MIKEERIGRMGQMKSTSKLTVSAVRLPSIRIRYSQKEGGLTAC